MNVVEFFESVGRTGQERTALVVGGRELTFGELMGRVDGYAHGLRDEGVGRGDRVLLMMKPEAEFIALVLGLLKLGATVVLVDPGMERRTLLECIERAAPTVLVAAGRAHLLAAFAPRAFASVRRRWLAGWRHLPGAVERLRRGDEGTFSCEKVPHDLAAAIVFTSGSTGTPKGVVYTHGNYRAQLDLLRARFGVGPNEVALPGYLPFTLLSLCLGSTCVVPNIPPARPAAVEPEPVLGLIARYRPSYGFGSPAFWERIVAACERREARLEGMQALLLFGTEVDAHLLRRLRDVLPAGASIHTPYGSTEAQPVTTITDRELLEHALLERRTELGVCVGLPFPDVEVALAPIRDEPIERFENGGPTTSPGVIGEVVVRGPVVSPGYFRAPEADRLHKIGRGRDAWHRMGDCGSFDEHGRLWLAGRRTQRIRGGVALFPLPVEALVNRHPAVRRSALVGVGRGEEQRPVLVVEPADAVTDGPRCDELLVELRDLLSARVTRPITDVLLHPGLPVDCRHNAKIRRPEVAEWAAHRLEDRRG